MNYQALFMTIVWTLLLYLSRFFIPIVGPLIVLFTPVPLILAYVRDGRTEGTVALITVAVFTALLGGWHLGVIFVLGFGLMAVLIGEGMRQRMKTESIAVLGGLAPAIVLTGILLIVFSQFGKNPVAVAEQYLRDTVNELASIYTKAGLSDVSAAVTSIPETFYYYLVRLFPGIFIASMITQAAFCFGIVRAVMIRKQGAETGQASLALWHAPDTWVWGLIASLALLAIPNEGTRLVGWNLLILFGTLYLAQGAALTDFFLRKLQLHPAARAVIIAIIMLFPPVLASMIAIGIVDIWADFRKVREPAQKAQP